VILLRIRLRSRRAPIPCIRRVGLSVNASEGCAPCNSGCRIPSTPELAAEVARAIGAVAELDPEDEALLNQFERWAAETLVDGCRQG
jgi:hypothetical protein